MGSQCIVEVQFDLDNIKTLSASM